jgi:hypothetical protein
MGPEYPLWARRWSRCYTCDGGHHLCRVLFESCLTSSAYRRKIEMHLLTPLAKVMLGFLGA